MRRRHVVICLAFAALVFVLVSSYQDSRAFIEIKCVLSDSVTKQPLEGAQVSIDTKTDQLVRNAEKAFEHETDKHGMNDIRLVIDRNEFHEKKQKWCLKIVKTGYLSQIIDLTPHELPESTSLATPQTITVVVYLQPGDER